MKKDTVITIAVVIVLTAVACFAVRCILENTLWKEDNTAVETTAISAEQTEFTSPAAYLEPDIIDVCEENGDSASVDELTDYADFMPKTPAEDIS